MTALYHSTEFSQYSIKQTRVVVRQTRNRSSDRLNNLFKVTELIKCVEIEIEILICLLPMIRLLIPLTLLSYFMHLIQ